MNPNVSRLVAVVGGQYGSEGKGAVCAALAARSGSLTAIRTGGRNAGHTVYSDLGVRWTFSQVPSVAVVRRDAELVISAGSEVHVGTLEAEIAALDEAGYRASERTFVDWQASVNTDEHADREGNYGGHLTKRLGSTGKGIGACRADRAMRTVDLYMGDFDATEHLNQQYLGGGRTMLVEGSQGFALGQHAGYYPHCTSRDCRAVDELAAIGILPLVLPEIWVVLRTYPIRVAGDSGPLLGETSWGTLHRRSHGYIDTEMTTVTKQVRRVGEWDGPLARRAVAANGGEHCRIALQMFDYWYPDLAGADTVEDLDDLHFDKIAQLEQELGAPIGMVGTGPTTVIHRRGSVPT
jgi:adenylosuccinate synthase